MDDKCLNCNFVHIQEGTVWGDYLEKVVIWVKEVPAYGKIVLLVPEQVSIHIVGRDVHAEMQIPDNLSA